MKTIFWSDKSTKLKIGSSQSQCQNQKNTVDPEKIIKLYAIDAVRFFYFV